MRFSRDHRNRTKLFPYTAAVVVGLFVVLSVVGMLGQRSSEATNGRALLQDEEEVDRSFGGWVVFILKALGTLYMFLGLAIVCDDYFVVSLERFSEVLGLTPDIAGATFMAAGSSAPELFTSLISAFDTGNSTGVGTIVGSAVFNITVVIGITLVAAGAPLALDWRPLTRDTIFYVIVVVFLLIFFSTGNGNIDAGEALLLLGTYFAYLVYMSQNEKINRGCCPSAEEKEADSTPDQDTLVYKLAKDHHSNEPRHWATIKVATDLMLYQGDKMMDNPVAPDSVPKDAPSMQTGEKAPAAPEEEDGPAEPEPVATKAELEVNPEAAAGGKKAKKAKKGGKKKRRRSKSPRSPRKSQDGASSTGGEETDGASSPEAASTPLSPGDSAAAAEEPAAEKKSAWSKTGGALSKFRAAASQIATAQSIVKSLQDKTLDDLRAPTQWDVPEGGTEKVMYFLAWPIKTAFSVTIPDCMTPKWKKYYYITFFMSIAWIGVFSLFMVSWAGDVGKFIGIPDVIMGLTILAAGTSVPDALSSVIVARNGLGSMAIANSLGSNVFDIVVGLGLPWLLAYLVCPGEGRTDCSVSVNADGLPLYITLDFGILLAFMALTAIWGFKPTAKMGYVLFVLYVVFVAVSLMTVYPTGNPIL